MHGISALIWVRVFEAYFRSVSASNVAGVLLRTCNLSIGCRRLFAAVLNVQLARAIVTHVILFCGDMVHDEGQEVYTGSVTAVGCA